MSIGEPPSAVARGCARGRPAVKSANLGPCPRFDAGLSTNEIKLFVLDAQGLCGPSPSVLSTLLLHCGPRIAGLVGTA